MAAVLVQGSKAMMSRCQWGEGKQLCGECSAVCGVVNGAHVQTGCSVHVYSGGVMVMKGWCGEVGGWGRDPFSRNFMKPTPRRKWYLTTGRRFH